MKSDSAYPIVVRPALATAALLALPLLAMQFVEGEGWSVFDFAFAGTLLFSAALAYEVATRRSGSAVYRGAVALALAAGFFLLFVSQGVSIIGADGDPANLMYLGVIAVGIVGAAAARLQPRGMVRAMAAMAIAMAVIAAAALVMGLGQPASQPLEILGLTGMFGALFLASAWLFRKAAAEQGPAAR